MAKTAKLCRDRRPRLRVGEVGSVFCVGFGLTNGRPGSNGAPDYESGGQEFESLRARQKNLNIIGALADVRRRVASQLHCLSQQSVSRSRILFGRPH
jgi:hypothetical protein